MTRKVLVIRRIVTALVIVLVGGAAIYVATRPKLPPILQDATIALTTSDQWRHMQQTLQSPVDIYAAAWHQSIGESRIATNVGVAAMADGDTPDAFCVPNVLFDLNDTRILYCNAKHAGPDPLPQAGFILVPYAPYMAALPDVSTEDGQVVARQGTALLLARGYAWHLIIQFMDRKLISPEKAEKMQIDCLAGLTLRAYLPSLDKARWQQTLAFVDHFTVQVRQTNSIDALLKGYKSGRLSSCMG